jgi:regulator of protease activity HflC (stomatin/prohibitin superfamily)
MTHTKSRSALSATGTAMVGTLILIVAVIVFLWYWSRCDWIDWGEVGMMYSAGRGLDRTRVYTPGRVYVPPFSTLIRYPTKQMIALYTNDESVGEVKAADAVAVTTNDNASTNFDVQVLYHVRKEDVPKLYDTFRGLRIEDIQAQHIRAALREAANDVGTRYDAFELMGVKRKEASDQLERKVTEILAPKGITVDSADFLGHYANQQINQRIIQRVNALTELEISKIRNKMAQIQRKTDVVRAQAQAQAQQIAGNQTTQRSVEMLKLESDLKWLEKWDGQMPLIQPKPGQSLIVGPDLLKSLEGRQ